jgi:hypothetical protein
MTVIKRDGKVEDLEPKKILNSIIKANDNVKSDEKLTSKQLKRITDSVVAFCETMDEPIDIDILEDVIEKKLMEDCEIRIRREVLNQINANIPPIRDLVVKGVELINLQDAASEKTKMVEMATPIENLNLSVRAYNCLKRAGYNTLHDIIIATEESDEKLLRVRNLGRKSILEITSMLYEFGYRETPGLRH